MNISKLICIFSVTVILSAFSGCRENDSKLSSDRIHLYDYEQTAVQLGITPSYDNQEQIRTEPLNFSPQYGMWFTALDYPDVLTGKTEKEFTDEINRRFKNAASIGINTVYVQVRAFGDAYYSSEIFSRGLSMTDDCDYDPLEIMTESAHSHGLSIHAWINPLRCQSDVQMQEMDSIFTLKKWYDSDETNGKYIVRVGDRYWLCPAYEDVRKFIAEGAAEIVRNYDVDGIQIDDYFYPTAENYYDEKAFSQSDTSDISAFRKEQCSLMVSAIYKAVKAENPEVLFGISPQGTINGCNTQYADVKKWCSEEGFCDYIIPQIYFGLENETAPFKQTAEMWKDMVTNENTDLIAGICTYKMGKEDKYAGSGRNEWQENFSICSEETEIVREMGLGAAFYSYASTFEPSENISNEMKKERSAIETLLSK